MRMGSKVITGMLLTLFLIGMLTKSSIPILAATEEIIIYDNGHRPHIDQYKAASFINLMREYGTVQISYSVIAPELLRNVTLVVIPSPYGGPWYTAAEIHIPPQCHMAYLTTTSSSCATC